MHIRPFNALLKGSISEITIDTVLQLKGNICNDYTGWFITCATSKAAFTKISQRRISIGLVSFQTKRFSYLFHVSVVHGVVRHFIWLEFNNLLQLIAITFPLADNDHFIKQEYIPGDTYTCICWKMRFVAPIHSHFSEHGLTGPVLFGWRWSTPSALHLSLASRTPPVSPAA